MFSLTAVITLITRHINHVFENLFFQLIVPIGYSQTNLMKKEFYLLRLFRLTTVSEVIWNINTEPH